MSRSLSLSNQCVVRIRDPYVVHAVPPIARGDMGSALRTHEKELCPTKPPKLKPRPGAAP